jgi:hypothetical protein
VATAKIVMVDATIFLTVASGFHYAWVASQRIGLATEADSNSSQDPGRR